jgi:hypothetical protein
MIRLNWEPCLGRIGALVLLGAAAAHAQTYAEITGTVTDASGGVIPGAVVSVSNAQTNQARSAITNESGNYTIPFLVPGRYETRVQHQGFKASVRTGIEIQVGDVARVDFALEVGAVSEVVEVTGGAPLIETDNSAVGTVIENKRIVELPLNGRNYLQMIALSPNVTAEQGAGGEAGDRKGGERSQQAFSIAGQRMVFNHFTLDGVENTNPSYNLFAIRPSIDALQEFKVQTGVYSAEYGRATAQINVNTKQGTNRWHGALFEFHRNENVDAREWRKTGPRNPFVRNQFGFTIDGPLVKNRLFVMSNFEALRERKSIQVVGNVAPDPMRAGDFSRSGRQVFDPASRVYERDAQGNPRAISATPFPNQIIPSSRIHPISTKLLEFFPRATVPGDSIFRNFLRDASRPINWEQFTQRIDFSERASSNWFGRFSWGDETASQLTTFEQQQGRTVTKTYQAMLSNTRTFGTSTVNEFRFGYTQFQNDNLFRYANERNVTAELAITGLPVPVQAAWGTPNIGLGLGLSGFGEPVNGPFVERSHIFQFLDNVSVVRGNHSFKFGAEYRRNRFNELGNAFPRGAFAFDAKATFDPARRADTGHPFGDYLLGESRQSQRILLLPSALLRSNAFSAYFEDTWKITSRLTMNAGLRYEFSPPYSDKYDAIVNLRIFDPGVGPNGLLPDTRVPVLTRPGSGDFYRGIPFRFHDPIPIQSGGDELGRELVRKDYNDFGPRIGLAYRPSDRWSIRAGFGIFYSQDIGEVRFDLARNLGARSSFVSDEERPNSNLSNPWAFETATSRCTGWSAFCQGVGSMLSNNTNRRTPYVVQWVFDVQRQLDADTTLELDYLGSGGHKLERWRNWNEAIPRTGPGDSRPLQQRRPWPAYGIIFNVDGVVDSSYHAGSVKLRRRFSKGLTYLAGLTWSKSIDTGSAIRNHAGDSLFPATSYDIRSWRGLSQFHTGRRLVMSVLYDLPFGGSRLASSSRLVNRLVSGWQVGSIFTFSDGTPQQVGGIGDTRNTEFDNYPDATGISPIPGNRSADNFWNIAAFGATSPELAYRIGSAGRNTLLSPGLRMWDFSVLRNIRILEGHALQLRFEGFNVANHPNWNAPPSDIRNAATFGRVASARTMRELQFGVKYIF